MLEVISQYLSLLDSQRESAFAALNGLTNSPLWQRPAPKEWSIGEILDNNYLLTTSMLPAVQWIWKLNGWHGRLKRIGIYHNQLHYDDVIKQAKQFKPWL